jgi:hypothetical protein
MPRQTLSASHLYAILDQEFKRRRLQECQSCRVPLPFFRSPPDAVSANWAIGTPFECPKKCHAVIAEVLVELWAKYDIRHSEPA